MDRIIIKNADNLNVLIKDLPNSDSIPDKGKTDLKEHFKKRNKPFRNEVDGRDEVMLDGSSGYRDGFSGQGTDCSFSGDGLESGRGNGW